MNLTALFSIALTTKKCDEPAELVWLAPLGFNEIPPRAQEGPFSIRNYTYYEKAIPHAGMGWPAPSRDEGDRQCLMAADSTAESAAKSVRSPFSVGLEALLRLMENFDWSSNHRAAVVVLDRAPGWEGAGAAGVAEWNAPRDYKTAASDHSTGGWGSIGFASKTDGVDHTQLQEYWKLAALLERYDTARDEMDKESIETLARLHQKMGPHPWPSLAPYSPSLACWETDYPSKGDLVQWIKQSDIRVAVLVTHAASDLLEYGGLDVEGLRVGHLDLSSADLLARILCTEIDGGDVGLLGGGNGGAAGADGGNGVLEERHIAIVAASAGFAVSVLGLGIWKGAVWCGGRGGTKPLRGAEISDDESIELDDRYTETSDRERIQRVNFDMFT